MIMLVTKKLMISLHYTLQISSLYTQVTQSQVFISFQGLSILIDTIINLCVA